MKRWRVSGSVLASTYVGVVEAKTQKEAIEKGWETAYVSVCSQCADNICDPEISELFAEEIKEGERR